MKAIKNTVAASGVAALLCLVTVPSNAQLSMADAEFAFHDGVESTEYVLNSVGDADVVESVAELKRYTPEMSDSDWQSYGRQLENALASDHQGLQNSALRLVIAYSDNLDLSSEAVVDVMYLYREGETDQIRRMAVVALGQMDSDLAIDYLARSYQFERSESVKKTIRAVVNESKAAV